MNDNIELALAESLKHYRDGTYRDRIVHDLILADATRLGDRPVFLDIGCGRGFDTDVPLQQSLVRVAGSYIGIEPDTSVTPGDYIKDVRRCLFEQAELPPNSVHIGFAIMVLEHLADPQPFWNKLWEVLIPGGVFWGLTVDARHWFCTASTWSQRLGLKQWYLSWLFGGRGTDYYENYPVFYRCNDPKRIAKVASAFSSVHYFNLSKVGQCDPLFPSFLRPFLGGLSGGQRDEVNLVRC